MSTIEILEELRQQQDNARPGLQKLVEHVVEELSSQIRFHGVSTAIVTGRVKDTASLVKKAIRKSYTDPWNDIRDKAGVRVTAVFFADLDTIDAVIRDSFANIHVEDKIRNLDPTTFDYLGVHYEVTVPTGVVPESVVRDCEIQVRTSVQTAWAGVSHDLFYKAPIRVSADSRRSLHRLLALVELFDLEVHRIREAIMGEPDFWTGQVIEHLERGFLSLTGRPFDPQLSRFVVDNLQSTLPSEGLTSYLVQLDLFIQRHRLKLHGIYEDYRHDDRNPLMSQPESLLIFERLNADRFVLKDRWPVVLPIPLLESMANVWGTPIDAADDY